MGTLTRARSFLRNNAINCSDGADVATFGTRTTPGRPSELLDGWPNTLTSPDHAAGGMNSVSLLNSGVFDSRTRLVCAGWGQSYCRWGTSLSLGDKFGVRGL